MSSNLRGAWPALFLLASPSFLFASAVDGAFINFDNCLDTAIVKSNPQQLQFTPLFFDARFDTSHPTHNLNVTIYGNVSGQQVVGQYPPPNSPDWNNPNVTFGKVTDVGSDGNFSTLFSDFQVLTWNAFNAPASEFCRSVIDGACPLGPSFNVNASNPSDLSAFTIAHDFGSSYAFTTLAGTMRVISGNIGAQDLACISANITPDLGPRISGLLTWLPAAVLIVKGIATLSAAIWSPWGSSDIFRWSSNYGRDEDLLRLVTPGFGDCLQYIQFVTLTGALSLQYPGFYQPAVSQTSWSLLLFNESFVSHGSGTQSLIDGIYAYNGTFGMSAMSQLIGMTRVEDIWACMAIWLLVIAGCVVLLCQLGFLGRWIYLTATKTEEQDLRSKNLPFTLGNMIRLLFNYFILPIVAISLFQLVITTVSPAVVVAMAIVLLVIMILGGIWILRVIFSTKPRTILFDDMPTVLMYGPLYNTYSDSAAPFALVPVFITFMRGVAFGAIQPSGIAQIIVLAICEVILILTLNGFRPFQGQTSMNAYHTFFATVRLITVLLSISFVPSLGVSQAPKGWIGYVILFLHGCVLVFGFFLNAAQTIVEVIARSCGVAGDSQTGAIRGSILNLRMLKKRRDRAIRGDRESMTSNAAILRDSEGDTRSAFGGRRSRSISASSQQLLNKAGSNTTPSMHRISGFENFSSTGEFAGGPNADVENAYSYLPTNGHDKSGPNTTNDGDQTYYRPPRPRKATLDALSTPGTRTRSGDFPYQDSPENPGHLRQTSAGDAALFPSRDSPAPAYFRDRSDSNENNPRTDYAVREVDQYYRGPALSDQPARKLKTGPADPEGPAASAQSWLQKMLFGVKQSKRKEPSKGFEVVRSSRMPPGLAQHDGADEVEMQTSPPIHQEPYRDSPPMQQGELPAGTGAERDVSPIENDGSALDFGFGRATRSGAGADQHGTRPSYDTGVSSIHPGIRAEQPAHDRSINAQDFGRPSMETEGSRYDRPSSEYPDENGSRYANVRYSTVGVPTLDPIDSVGSFDLPSRFNSHRSQDLGHFDLDGSAAGQQWLSAVDNLSWNHEQRSASGTSSLTQRQPPNNGSNDRFRNAVPHVPRRSSRRTPSQGHTPRVHSMVRDHEDIFDGFDSGDTALDLNDPRAILPEPSERPNNSRVNHHRAADSITRNSFGANAAMQGTSAEIIDRVPPAEEYLGGMPESHPN